MTKKLFKDAPKPFKLKSDSELRKDYAMTKQENNAEGDRVDGGIMDNSEEFDNKSDE